MKKFFLFSTVLGVLLTACSGTSVDQNAEPVNVGFIAPLTGDQNDYGIDSLNGLKLAVNEVNTAGGIDGRPVRIFAEDGKCTEVNGASAAEKLVDTYKVLAIIGGYCAAETLGASSITEERGVALLSFGSGSSIESDVGTRFEKDFTDSFGAPKTDFVSPARAYSAAKLLFETMDSFGTDNDAIYEYLK